MTDTLRAALSADDDTPAGIDVAAVRTRAGRLRHTRYAIAGAAAVTALAVAVPIAAVRPGTPSVTAAAPPALICPDRLPASQADPHATGDLLPGPPTEAVLCTFDGSGRLSESAPLSAALTATLGRRLADLDQPTEIDVVCTTEHASPFAIRLGGPDWTTTVRIDPIGCPRVGNGEVMGLSQTYESYLLPFANGTGR